MHIDAQSHVPLKWSFALLSVCLSLFILMSYGGIRTPDGEIVFRVGESLARHGHFAIDAPLATWEPFAVLKGRQNNLYGVFAPAQSILLAPLIKAGLIINKTGWYEHTPLPIPASFGVDAQSLKHYAFGIPPDNPEPHALRFIASFFNPIAASFLLLIFFYAMVYTTRSCIAGFFTALLLAFATPVWSYSGTMFKEPMTMGFVVLSFFYLVKNDSTLVLTRSNDKRVLLAGLFGGLAFTTHLTAILFIPFLGAYALFSRIGPDKPEARAGFIKTAGAFTGGFIIPTALFALYNYHRFGNILTTGRSSSDITYGTFVMPWEGLWGLLASPGKGIFFFCPAVIAGIVLWPYLHRKSRRLSILLAAMILFRLLFVACRSDWHGGFCLGPRFLLPVMPFLLMPVGIYVTENGVDLLTGTWKRLITAGFLFAAVCQQIYFCLGEPISFYYILKARYLVRGINIITTNDIYFQWPASPLLHLLSGRRGPFLLQWVPLSNLQLFCLLAAVLAGLTAVFSFYLAKAKSP
ncbi:MAG: glycosyltransferase 87 family protein [Thermodesulfobacteriota bacterium]|nr:glycosyltransferase 87 family protein [Thermodesulfobacteriota bacterium]